MQLPERAWRRQTGLCETWARAADSLNEADDASIQVDRATCSWLMPLGGAGGKTVNELTAELVLTVVGSDGAHLKAQRTTPAAHHLGK